MRMRRKPGHNGLAQLAKVVREGGHFVAEHPGVDEQHASPAVHDNGVALAELALVDQHTLRDLPQHRAPSACGPQPLVETVVPGCSRVPAGTGSLLLLKIERRVTDQPRHPARKSDAHPLISIEYIF